jgi:predicted ATP-grasp superfamily ATP-dependent carboligase
MARGDRDPLAVVMGDVDMVRALGVAGISSAFFGFADDSARFSRHVRVSLPWIDQWERQDELAAALLALARAQPQPPVLFPQTDAALLLASRYRERLAGGLRLLLADRLLLEQLVDKGRFEALAARHDLPVPPAQRLRPAPDEPAPALEVPFPLIVKPFTRTPAWTNVAGASKALHVLGREDFEALWPRLRGARTELLAQQLIPGPESRIESFHVYVDASGSLAGEFTGRKIRTFPRHYGQSTAVEVVPLPDVAELGREVVGRLALRGVAKLDFKRDDRGRLHLLEVNPRFNLWHYPGALAGVNLPAMVYADLTGRERAPAARVHRRVTWCDPLQDLRAMHTEGIALLAWLRWLRGCEAFSGLAREDPLPFLRGKLWAALRRRVSSRAIRVVRPSGAGRIAPRARRGKRGSSE